MIKVENFRKTYDGFSIETDIEVKSGYITGLIGPNGAGKSTLFKGILGLISSDGEIIVNNKNIKDYTAADKKKLVAVLSDSTFSKYLTPIAIKRFLEKMYDDFDGTQFDNLCKNFGVPQKKPLKEMSSGTMNKAKIIFAISANPDILILDEPTVGLDVLARDIVYDALRDFVAEKEDRCILISSHIQSDIENLCDDIYVIGNGKMLLHEDTDVLLAEYGLIKVSNEMWEKIDKDYILCSQKEAFGISALTNKRQFYMENYPEIVIEKGCVDDVIRMMSGGNAL